MIELYGILMVVILTWINYGVELPVTRKHRDRLNFKPFNCLWCLSFWVGLIASLITLNFLFITLPLSTYYFDDAR